MKAIIIAGNIGRDAVTRTTQGGDKITGWSVAVEAGFGQNKRTLWFDCSWFGGRGEKLAQYLTKGSKVTVSGDFDTREHEGKTYLQLRVNDVTDYHPAIAPGETLSIVRETDRGYWIKKNGVSGWYSGRIERLKAL